MTDTGVGLNPQPERAIRSSTDAPQYYAPQGGLPGQSHLSTDRAMFTQAFAVLPKGSMTDIVASRLPFWDRTRLWVIARPLTGFAETFSQYVVEVTPGGGSDTPETDAGAEAVLFVVEGSPQLTVGGQAHGLEPGSYAYLPAGTSWTLHNRGDAPARFHWIRKAYQSVPGIEPPEAFVTNERDIEPIPMPDTGGAWTTTHFVEQTDMRHDMHVNIVTFEPGGAIPFTETMSWSTGCTCCRARRSTCSTSSGSRSKPGTSCGCGRSVRRRATPVGRADSGTCCTRTSTGTSR